MSVHQKRVFTLIVESNQNYIQAIPFELYRRVKKKHNIITIHFVEIIGKLVQLYEQCG